jgi:hypothetical protein
LNQFKHYKNQDERCFYKKKASAHPDPSSSKTQPTRRHAPQMDSDAAGLRKLFQ